MARPDDQHQATPGVGPVADRAALAAHFVRDAADVRRLSRDRTNPLTTAMRDWMMIADARQFDRDAVFLALRWGGQAVVSARSPREADALLQQFASRDEWRVDTQPVPLELPARSWVDRFRKRRRFVFVARKVLLELPDRPTFRHSYDVRLAPYPGVEGGYCVQKRIPPPEQIRRRLLQNLPPDVRPDAAGLEQMIRKLLHKVFPLFLTREAGFLKILQRDLPEPFRGHVPDVFDLEYDAKGYVSCLRSRWLRLGGDPMTPMAFATQAADLLRCIHEKIGIVHLDLRLDNFLITEGGVKLVDFGSALRRGESIHESPILTKLFTEMLSASQIRRDLLRMIDKQHIVSAAFAKAYQPPGPAADLFSVVNNFGRLGDHPDFHGLTLSDPAQDAELTRVRREVFRPTDPAMPSVYRLRDLCRRLHEEASRPRAVPLAQGAVRFDTPICDPAADPTKAPAEPRLPARPSMPFTVMAEPAGV